MLPWIFVSPGGWQLRKQIDPRSQDNIACAHVYRVASVDSATAGSIEQIENIMDRRDRLDVARFPRLPIGEPMRSFNLTPDKPQGFGFKVLWFALKASNPAAVVEALELREATPANWESGLAAAYDSQRDDAWVFVSPPVGGWVLVVGCLLPYPTTQSHDDAGAKFDALFSRLMKRSDDVQFYGSHRVVDFVAWARALNGKPVRIFAWAGCDGVVLEKHWRADAGGGETGIGQSYWPLAGRRRRRDFQISRAA
jgi:hypothetical protein